MNNELQIDKIALKTRIRQLVELVLEKKDLTESNKIPKVGSFILFLILSAKETEAGKNLILSLFQKHEEIYQTIQTLIDAPNCQCRSKVVEFLSSDIPTGMSILNIIINREKDERTLRQMNSIAESGIDSITNQEFELSGKRVIIDNTEEAYFQKIMQISDPRYRYKGISINVIQDGKNLELFFY
jgi:hypothetical protein